MSFVKLCGSLKIINNMAIVKPFKGYRPTKEIAEQLASRPYDVLNSDEARDEAMGNKYSFLHVVKSEIDLSKDIDVHSDEVYNKAKENLQQFIKDAWLKQDLKPCYYIYAQTMNGRTQYGIVGCAATEDYTNNIIKKHELTRPDKEDDRVNHINITNFNAEPVFFAFPDHAELDQIIKNTAKNAPIYDFTLPDGIGHHFWMIDNESSVKRIEEIFKNDIKYTYVADGHHRTAAAARVGADRSKKNPAHTGNEEYNFFMAVHFPAGQLAIMDYNRVVKDLNGNTSDQFVEKLKKSFDIKEVGTSEYRPCCLHNISMYLGGKWYSLQAHSNTYNDSDPIGVLDVTILSNEVLTPILDITDLRKSTRIDFVGGIRGLGELKRRVDSGEMAAAFAIYPVSMKQLIDIADSGNIMPPKTTWFEPKLRSGLVIHCLD